MLVLMSMVPLAACLVLGDYGVALRYLVVMIVLLIPSALSWRLPSQERIQVNEALSITALIFVLSPFAMTYPLMAAGLSVGDALFEAISAVTTTGLSTVTDIEHRSRSFLFARAWMQWYGGLGIVVLSVALLSGPQSGAVHRLVAPPGTESLPSTTRIHGRRVLIVYSTFTVIGIAVVWALSGNGFAALTHVFSAVSTGGFSSWENSLAGFDNGYVRYAVIALTLLCAVPLTLYYRAWHRGWRELVGDIEFRALLYLSMAVCLLIFVILYGQKQWTVYEAAAQAVLTGISAQSTAGFSSMDVNALGDGGKFVLMLSMFVGGGVGSTAGGIKLLRLLIALRLVQLMIMRTGMPAHAVAEPRLAGKVLSAEDLQRVMLLIVLFIGTVAVSWALFVVSGHNAVDSLFEVISAVGTVGLSTGITSPELDPLLKGVLCADMLLGRLEIVALLVVLYPRTWLGKRVESL
jgi:trk system potassium uptake protein TrkH